MTPAPDRTLEQRRAALATANRIRTERARFKQQLRDGDVFLMETAAFAGAAAPDWLRTATILELLRAVPKVGDGKAAKALKLAAISPSRTVGGLSPRQRASLEPAIRAVASTARLRSTDPILTNRRKARA